MLKSSICIKPSDLCYLQSNPSTNRAAQIACPQLYLFNSGDGLCTINKETYLVFLEWIHLLHELKNEDLFNEIVKIREKFISNIRLCPLPVVKVVNVCIKRKDCLYKEKISISMRVMYGFTRVKCSCPTSHRFRCGNNFCAVDKKSCMNYLNNNETKAQVSYLTNKCKI